MNIDDILTLAKAGYTAEQISTLARGMNPAPAKPAEPAPAPAPAEPAPAVNSNAELLNAIKGLETTIKGLAVATTSQPAPKSETVDDIIASIINPQ